MKRYRYTGKERDEETGLNYHGARYYAPWLAGWTAAEPIDSEYYNLTHGRPNENQKRHFGELTASSFEYCYANQLRYIDPTGEQGVFMWFNEVLKAFFGGMLVAIGSAAWGLTKIIWGDDAIDGK